MKNINHKYLLALTILLFNSLAFSENKNLEDFFISDKSENLFSVLSDTDSLSFQDQWVLIVLNRNLQESKMLVDYLAEAFTNTESLMVIVLGNQASNKSFDKNKNLERFKRLNLSDSNILNFLATRATPLIIGMNNNTVKWKIAGFNEDSDFLHNLIEKWSFK